MKYYRRIPKAESPAKLAELAQKIGYGVGGSTDFDVAATLYAANQVTAIREEVTRTRIAIEALTIALATATRKKGATKRIQNALKKELRTQKETAK